MINKEYKEVCTRNDELSRKKSSQVLEVLQKPLQTKIDSGHYFKIGGYTEYQQDIAEMVKKFLMTPGKGVQVIYTCLEMFKHDQRTCSKVSR